jgi:hypothetical protein
MQLRREELPAVAVKAISPADLFRGQEASA